MVEKLEKIDEKLRKRREIEVQWVKKTLINLRKMAKKTLGNCTKMGKNKSNRRKMMGKKLQKIYRK